MPLGDILDLNRAFRRIDKDKRDDACPDIVGYRDYKNNLDEHIDLLKQRLEEPRNWLTSSSQMIDIPKKGYTLRPGVVPFIDDRVIYQAIADYLAPFFQPESSVYSNRLAGLDSSNMFIQGVELWIEFQNKVEELSHQYPFVVETDITAFFDHINHELLLSRIEDLFTSKVDRSDLNELKILLRRLLGKWTYTLKNFGIPQLNDASSFFANLYLDDLDKWLYSHNFVALRYVDDIRIFAQSEPDARRVLAELIIKLRKMGLYIATGKTKIIKTQEVIRELETGRHRVNEIETEIDSGNKDRVEKAAILIEHFFMNLIETTSNFDDRMFRYCVNRFKRLHVSGIGEYIYPNVIREVISRMELMPQSTKVFIDYLSLFPNNEEILNSILEFLQSQVNIYPWQEMELLELLIRMDIAPDNRSRINKLAVDVVNNNRHPICTAKAVVLRGKNGTYSDRRDIRDYYYKENRMEVKRAIIVGIQEMQPGERDNFYRNIASESKQTEDLTQYIKLFPEPKYHYYNPPFGYHIIPDEYDSDDLYDLGSEYFL